MGQPACLCCHMLICKMVTQRVLSPLDCVQLPPDLQLCTCETHRYMHGGSGLILSPGSHSHLLHYDRASRSTSNSTQAAGTEAILNREPSSGEPGSHAKLFLSSFYAAAFCLPEKGLPHRIQRSSVTQNSEINQSTSSSHRSDPDVSILSQDDACL